MRDKIVKVFENTIVYTLVVVMSINMSYMPVANVSAQEIKTETVNTKETKNKNKTELKYRAYSENKGWSNKVKNGKKAGKKDKDLKAISIDLTKENGKSGIKYKTYVSDKGWTKWKNSGQTSGSTKKGKSIEATKIKLSKDLTKKYDICYRLYTETDGWTLWSKNGAVVGEVDEGASAESIQIKLVKKDKVFKTDKKYPTLLSYSSGVSKGAVRHVSQVENLSQNGWIYKKDGNTYDFRSIADGECALSSSCMALSYLGIDISPGEFAYNCGGGSLYFATKWAEWRNDVNVRKSTGSSWKNYYNDYKNDKNYKYSPVIVQLTRYCYTNSHYVVIVGKNADGTYKVYDCSYDKEWNATIKGNSVSGLGGKAGGTIANVRQYYK